jgi:8-oxo-dGTP pyrophosphatase MutT (NUDIX family)
MHALDTDDLPDRLRHRLRRPLPGIAAQRLFAPELSYGRHFMPPMADARPASVAVLLYRRAGQWLLPLTVRPDTMLHHGGQISLPGGQVEKDETPVDAARRELHEELDVPSAGLDVLGELSPIYLYGSNYTISAWLLIAKVDVQFTPSADEVSELIELPLVHLLDRGNRGAHVLNKFGVEFEAPHIAIGEHRIWGATSMILGELAAICDDLRGSDK